MIKKVAIICSALFMFMLAALIALPLFIDLSIYEKNIAASIEALTGTKPLFLGQTNVRFFPTPQVELSGVMIPNVPGARKDYIVSIKSIHIDSTFRALLTGSVEIKEIRVVQPVLELETLNNGKTNWSILVPSEEKRGKGIPLALPRSIQIEGGTVNYRSYNTESITDGIEALFTSDSDEGPYELSGRFTKMGSQISFESSVDGIKQNSRGKIRVFSKQFDVALSGVIEDEKSFRVSGNIKGAIFNLAEFVTQFSQENSIYDRIRSKEAVEWKGAFTVSEKVAQIQNLSIQSPSIEGEGVIKTSLDFSSVWDINVSMKKIDFDTLVPPLQETKNPVIEPRKPFKMSKYFIDIPQGLSLLFYFSINEMRYRGDIIRDVEIDADIFNKEVVVHSISASLPGNSRVSFYGNVYHNNIRPLFTGQLDFSGSDLRALLHWAGADVAFIPESQLKHYIFNGNVVMSPKKLEVMEGNFTYDESFATGGLVIRFDEQQPALDIDIHVDNMDMDRYGIPEKNYDMAAHFLATTKDHELSSSWLRLFGIRLGFALAIDNFRYNGSDLKDFNASLAVAPGLLGVQRLYFTSSDQKMGGSLQYSVNLNKQVPEIAFSVKSNGIDTGLFVPVALRGKHEEARWKWPEGPFNFWGIEAFKGGGTIAVNNFRHKKLFIDSLVTDIILKNNIVHISKLNSALYGGMAQLKGDIGIGGKASSSFGGSFSLAGVNIKPLQEVFLDKSYISGKLRVGGTASSFGMSLHDWVKQLTAGFTFQAQQVKVEAFDLPSLIYKGSRLYSALDMETLAKKALEEGVTDMENVVGKIDVIKGMASSNNIQIRAGAARGAMGCKVDLNQLTLNSITKFSFAPERGEKVTLVVRAEGPLGSLKKSLDIRELENYITEKAAR